MHVIASDHRTLTPANGGAVIRALAAGLALLAGASFLAYLAFGTNFLEALTPSGRAPDAQPLLGALAWTFGLTAPAAFGVVGLARVSAAIESLAANRGRATPVLRSRGAISDDHAVAVGLRLADGGRTVPEIVIGPFGAAVIEELPPASAVTSRGPRHWEVRAADGTTHMIEQPLERARRDADRVRAWLSGEDADHVVKVFAAVVGTDPDVARTSSCAVITPAQIGPWLASLPAQRSFDADRRDRVTKMVRTAL